MPQNRLTNTFFDMATLVQTQAHPGRPAAFAICPVQYTWQHEIYRRAFEQALASIRAAWLERVRRVCWN